MASNEKKLKKLLELEWSVKAPIGPQCPYCGRFNVPRLLLQSHDPDCKIKLYIDLAKTDSLYQEQFDQLIKELQ